nr:MAG TPA: hypothetical protein [Caudoviricetes sp.]
MNKNVKYFLICGLILSILSVVNNYFLIKSKTSTDKKWKEAVENAKAYSELFSNSESKNRAFKLTIDQLKNSNDSIFQELNEARKELKVKDSKIKSLQYVSSNFSKVDTITLKCDTIFKDSHIDIDTLLFDDWYSVKVGLKYPSTVTVEPTFKSIKYIVVSAKKETVNPPKRFFLFRWFQKKQIRLNVDVVEKNPYMQNQDNRFIEIVR